MKLHLSCSGGFGGLCIEGSVDTAELPGELAGRVEAQLHPEKLAVAENAAASPSPQMTDSQLYELKLLPEKDGENAREHKFDDSALSDDLYEVLDELCQEIIRKKRAAAKA